MTDVLEKCTVCPRACGVNRNAGVRGRCHENATVEISRASLHLWEEPPISGAFGSGTVFFTGCSLGCIYCQNHNIADGNNGIPVTPDGLAHIFLKLQDMGANNVNLVTPTHFVPQIAEVLRKVRNEKTLRIPVVYNTSAYESVDTLKMLDGLVDIYLPDFKYCESDIAEKYSAAADYPAVAKEAIIEMVRQVGSPLFYTSPTGEEDMLKKGVIIRHLVLPGCVSNSKKVLKTIRDTFGDDVIVSIMNQYTPLDLAALKDYPELCRKVTAEEYDEILEYALDIGMNSAFVQEDEAAVESFIPNFENFDLDGFLSL